MFPTNTRNTIWPDGKRSNQSVSRDDNTKLRTRMAAKVALFTLLAGNDNIYLKLNHISISILIFPFVSLHCVILSRLIRNYATKNQSHIADDLKHVVGSETTRYGLLNCFSMWQHKTLNKRLVLVLFNEILTTLYQTDDLTKHVKWNRTLRKSLTATKLLLNHHNGR